MQVKLQAALQGTPQGARLQAELSKCVHCGFCNATCPTYRLSGHELEGPRGRIDLIKQMAEGREVGPKARVYLDHCLHCLSCETTCPSGVLYGRLIDEGRVLAERIEPSRALLERSIRWGIRCLLTQALFLRFAMPLMRRLRSLLPQRLRENIQPRRASRNISTTQRTKAHLLYLGGCVEPHLQPAIESALRTVSGVLGYEAHRSPGEGCCGALGFHLGHQEQALESVRGNIDAWWPYVEGSAPGLEGQGVKAILVSSSGCGAMIQGYAELLCDDPVYAERAKTISGLFQDPVEWLEGEGASLKLRLTSRTKLKITLHEPCSLQHGLKLKGRLESLLKDLGCDVIKDAAPELCCGAAGAYSMLYPEISAPLRDQKREALGMGVRHESAVVLSSNIGCLQYLSTPDQPVLHWLEWLARRLADKPGELQTIEDSPRV